MVKMTLKSKLKEIKDRCDAATDGPWFRIPGHSNKYHPNLEWEQWITNDTKAKVGGEFSGVITLISNWSDDDKVNANFIANARTDLPMLLEMLEFVLYETSKTNESEYRYFVKNLKKIEEKYSNEKHN